jgi:hypothetical protein
MYVEKCKEMLEERYALCRGRLNLARCLPELEKLLSLESLVPSPSTVNNVRYCYQSMGDATDLLNHL